MKLKYNNNHKLHVMVRDIDWEPHGGKEVDLPQALVIPITYAELNDEETLRQAITHYLSDSYGCVANGYELGWKKKDEV